MPLKISTFHKHNTKHFTKDFVLFFTYPLLCSCEDTVRCCEWVRSSALLLWMHPPSSTLAVVLDAYMDSARPTRENFTLHALLTVG